MFKYTPKKDKLKIEDSIYYKGAIDMLLNIEFSVTNNYRFNYNCLKQYNIRNPIHFLNATHFNEYKEERLNYFMDLLEQLKKYK